MLMGIKALHDLKILHRDLKSANVFLFKDGTVKIGDMNVSKIAKKGLLNTQTGTPYYASPEVWNDTPYDFKYQWLTEVGHLVGWLRHLRDGVPQASVPS